MLLPLLPLLAPPARAEAPLVLEGEVPDEGDFFRLPFAVPPDAAELAVTHAAGDDADVLDWGLLDPAGTLRGWGGGNTEDAVVGVEGASRSGVVVFGHGRFMFPIPRDAAGHMRPHPPLKEGKKRFPDEPAESAAPTATAPNPHGPS